MDRWIGGLGAVAVLFMALPAVAETSSLRDETSSSLKIPCASSAEGHVLPSGEQRGATTVYEICNGSAYEVLESAKAKPLRKGIGTDDPQATLDVKGAVRIGNDPAPCTPAKAGSLRWTGKAFEGCDGAAWSPLNTRGK